VPNTALKLDQIYTSRFTTGLAPRAATQIFPNSGPTVIDLHRRQKRAQRDFRELILDKKTLRPRRRRKKAKLPIKMILQGGIEAGVFGTIFITFIGSLWALAQ
jgi:hypothetical protein